MRNVSNVLERRKLLIIFLTLFLLLGLGMSSLTFGQANVIVVNSTSDVEKKNDGKCTLREAIIAANKDKPSGGKIGECAAGNPDGPNGEGDIILLRLPDNDITTDTDIFTLTRNDSGSEDSSTTGDLDITSIITITVSSPITIPVVIEGVPGFNDRIFHILSGSLTLDRVTIRGGNAKFLGGGIYVEGGTLNMTNSTLTANHAGTSGGAIYSAAMATLTHVTVKDNIAPTGGGLTAAGADNLTIQNTLIADNGCSGPLVGAGNNLTFEADGCTVPTVPGDPMLKAVPFGEKNAYFMLEEGSAAVDAADAAFGLPVDQIGLSRPQNGEYDIGAIEQEDVNDPPDAVDDPNVAAGEDTAVIIDVVSNDTDPDGNLDPASVTVVSGPGSGSALPTAGQPGKITYTPIADFNGSDSFTYQVCDTELLCDTALVTVTVNPVNDAPVATDDSATTGEDTAVNIDVQANDNAGPANEDQTLITTVTLAPSNGTPTINLDGSITYTPNANFNGSDSFTYKLCDSGSPILCDTAVVAVAVNPVNDAPLATDDSATTDEDTAVTIDVAANDSDVENNLDLASVSVFSSPSHGTAVPVGDGTIVYTPDPHFDGSDSFVYQICDTEPLCSTATVSITVAPDIYIEVTNVCDAGQGSLRQAVMDANDPGDTGNDDLNGTDHILFDILDTSCGTDTIDLQSELPALSEAVLIDGLATDGSFAPPANDPYIALDGACGNLSGFTILQPAGGSMIANLIIQNFGGSGIVIGDVGAPSDGNIIQGNIISGNGCGVPPVVNGTDPSIVLNDGITIIDGQYNQFNDNNIYGSADLNVDLGGDGSTPNDIDDPDDGPNYQQNFPDLLSATPGINSGSNQITGYLNSVPSRDFSIQFFVSDSCNGGGSVNTPLDIVFNFPTDAVGNVISTAADGNIAFVATVQNQMLLYDQFVTSTATDATGNTSEYSDCIEVDDDNQVWPLAWEVESNSTIPQKLIRVGQSRWYKFWVEPNSRFKIRLDLPPELAENYDLVVYNDILLAYSELLGDGDLNIDQLDAEFPNDAFAPALYSPALYSPALYSPALYSPALYSPALYSPALYSPALYSPDVYSPALYSPALYSPALYSPALYSPALYSSDVVGNAYSAAQMSSLVAASGNEGQLPEELNLSSYNNGGWYYARVRGRQGGYDPDIDFTVGLTIEGGVCENILTDFENLTDYTPSAVAGGYETVILVDWERMNLDPADQSALAAKLDLLAADLSVNGVVVDVGADPDVAQRNELADRFDDEDGSGDFYRICPFAKNIVADGIKEVIDAYRGLNPIEYVVIVGNDMHIPFYRYPDQSGLGPEEDYVVPVLPDSSSYASLRENYFLSQDGYGSQIGVAVKNDTLPIPDISVGRLVESPDEISHTIDVYLATPEIVPQTALVTAYDFLTDGGQEVYNELAESLTAANVNGDLIAEGQETWTADQLASAIDSGPRDLVFLSGHFSANSTLAADYATYYTTADFENSATDYTDALIFSAGCHSGYNIVNEHNIPNYTLEPDWAAVMARKGATLLAGTGYQYGDTDLIEYSERLYLEFTRQLRSGNEGDAIPIGYALVKAKQQYLAETPNMRGIHQKALLEATIYGLPHKRVNMPGDRLDPPFVGPGLVVGDLLVVDDNPAITTEPGESLGLHFYELNRSYNLEEVQNPLYDVQDINQTEPIPVSYLQNGPDGVVVNPGEPVLPLDTYNATVVGSNMTLRGVGFRGGNYQDFIDKIPLVAAATTEESAPHFGFLSFVFYVQQLFTVNRYDALSEADGSTLLYMVPAQYKTEQPDPLDEYQTATQRTFNDLQFRLYYLAEDFMDHIAGGTGTNRPDLAAAPTIVYVEGDPVYNGATDSYDVNFLVQALVDPSAGMQQVWVTYTEVSNPNPPDPVNPPVKAWISLDLTQDGTETMLWRGTLVDVADPQNMRFIAQAASGTGLVTMSNNLGRFYIPGGIQIQTILVETDGPDPRQGAYGSTVTFSANLTDKNDVPLANKPVLFDVGLDSRLGWTDLNGDVTVDVPIIATAPMPIAGTNLYGEYEVTISFPGTVDYAPSVADALPFTVLPQDTTVTLSPALVVVDTLTPDVPIFAQLQGMQDGFERPLPEKTVTFTVVGGGFSFQKAVITDPAGRARLGRIELNAPAEYTVTARFDGTSSYNPSASLGSSTIRYNRPPNCDNVTVKTANEWDTLWPANNKMINVVLSGATDPDGDELIYRYLDIWQDEDTGGQPDGTFNNDNSCAEVRAERDGNGNGRVYHIFYEVDDGNGGICSGDAMIATIPHDQSSTGEIDDGVLFDSLGDGSLVCTP